MSRHKRRQLLESSVTPRARSRAEVPVTAVQPRESMFGLSLSKASYPLSRSRERAGVRVMSLTAQRYRQPQSLPQRGRDTEGGFPQSPESSITPRARGRAEVTVTASQSAPSPHSALSVPSVVNPVRPEPLEGLLSPLPFAGEGWGEGEFPPGQRYRQPQSLPRWGRNTERGFLSLPKGEEHSARKLSFA